MKRPWQIWSLFALGLAIVIPAMGWLTVKALELDRAESIARRQAEQEESVSRALWRLDALLTPLLAQEAARPDFVYRPLYNASTPVGDKGAATKAISPLLVQPPDFVLVHFELHSDGRLTSPQVPQGSELKWAIENGAATSRIDHALTCASSLERELSHEKLLAELPDESLPEVLLGQGLGLNANATLTAEDKSIVVANTYPMQQGQAAAPPWNAGTQQASDYGPAPQSDPGAADLQQVEPSPAVQDRPSTANSGRQVGQPSASQQQVYSDSGDQVAQQVTRPTENAYGYSGPPRQARGGNDLMSRDAAYQAYASKVVVEQRQNLRQVDATRPVVEGVSRPLWVGEKLILARRVKSGNETLIQGCWLDWEKLQARMNEEIADLLPRARLSPVKTDTPPANARLLATLPVQLTVPPPEPVVAPFSPMRISLVVAWICLLAATLAAAATLLSVVALSERRAAFVSAVTHELRTPLTTFRMYAEMLSEGMVPEADQRQKYLETLRVEADRLHHLVENVLQYARLERGRPGGRREAISLGGLLERLVPRLSDRAQQAGMRLEVEASAADRETELNVDVGAVEQILFNLVDNACKYAAGAGDSRLHLEATIDNRDCRICIRDHGPGISAEGRRKLFQPFSKSVHEAAVSAPGVGLGLALCKRLSRDLGGELRLLSGQDGAVFELRLPR